VLPVAEAMLSLVLADALIEQEKYRVFLPMRKKRDFSKGAAHEN